MKFEFPYPDYEPLEVPDHIKPHVFRLPGFTGPASGRGAVRNALENPIGSQRLSEIARGKKRVLIVFDDVSRPTPIGEFVDLVLEELSGAGIQDSQIEFLAALGTHRAMTEVEFEVKLGKTVVERFPVHNHAWADPDALEYVGESDQSVPVWINKRVRAADLVVGLGAIMPLEVSGFTGGGKILVPGTCGEQTVDLMHWTRIDVPSDEILGRVENPVRRSIDSLARKAGLHFIVNVVLDANNEIVGSVAGDMVEAHRVGCRIAQKVFGVSVSSEYDIVVADAYPFDIEFWQANKALDTAGEIVKKDGVVILVSPCYEGFSQTHSEILEFGYPPIETIKKMVNCGKIKHKVVGVHMIQASTVAVEKAKLILVSSGISKGQAEKVGFLWADTPQKAFQKALEIVGNNPDIAILKGASRMLPLVNRKGD